MGLVPVVTRRPCRAFQQHQGNHHLVRCQAISIGLEHLGTFGRPRRGARGQLIVGARLAPVPFGHDQRDVTSSVRPVAIGIAVLEQLDQCRHVDLGSAARRRDRVLFQLHRDALDRGLEVGKGRGTGGIGRALVDDLLHTFLHRQDVGVIGTRIWGEHAVDHHRAYALGCRAHHF